MKRQKLFLYYCPFLYLGQAQSLLTCLTTNMVFHGTRRTIAFNAAEWKIHQVLSSHFIICDVLSTHALLIQRLEDNCLTNVLPPSKPQRRIYHAYFEAPNPQCFVLRDRRVLGSHSSIETESFIDLNDAHEKALNFSKILNFYSHEALKSGFVSAAHNGHS